MSDIVVPEEGRQTSETDPNDLLGVDANAFFILGHTDRLLKRAGATKEFRDGYQQQATTGNYDHLLAVSIAYLSAEPIEHDEA